MKKVFYLLFIIVSSINCQNDYYEDLIGDYVYIEEGAHQHAIEKMGKDYYGKLIPCEVLAYDYNKDFIIALQKPVHPCYIGYITDSIQYPANIDSVYYWIILHKQNSISGPLTKEDYEAKRIELKVPESLTLKFP